jgi:hypothetical protein
MHWDEREIIQQLDHNWCAFFDNVTSLPTHLSDTMCRAATGGGFSKRELYSDNDDVIYSFKRCIGLNGINIAAQRGDLLDRTFLVNLTSIPKNRRKTEAQLQREFEECRPEILGGFLDVLVGALRVYPSVNPQELFRMADFTRWGCAIAVALGKTERDFFGAYEKKVNVQIEEAAHSSPVATALLDLLEHRKSWDSTPTLLYTTLLEHAKTLGISTHQKAWPKAPHILVRQLNELAPSLEMLGWEITYTRTGAAKHISIRTVASVTSVTNRQDAHVLSNCSVASDASSLSSVSLRDKLENIRRWILANKEDDNCVSINDLTLHIKTLRVDHPPQIIELLKKDGVLFPVPHIDKLGIGCTE